MTIRGMTIAAIAAVLGLSATAWAEPTAAGRPAGAGAAAKAADANSGVKDIEELLAGLKAEDIEKLISSAIESRLKMERQQATEEIREGLLYEPDDIDAAVKMLENSPKNTQKDNIERIMKALMKVDLRLGQVGKLMDAKKFAEAAEAVKKELNLQEATYINAARYTLYAKALAAAGRGYEAVEAYQFLLVNMPDRVSFAAAAALDSARIFEQLNRFTYAGEMYAYAVKNYGLTLDKEALEEITKKLEEFSEFQKDPLGWASGLMGEVKKRLSELDSGQDTQKQEDKIVAVITDLIKTAEEKANAQQQQQQQQPKPGEGKPGEGKPGEGKPGEGKPGEGKSGQPQGTNKPNGPTNSSGLVPGAVARMTKRSEAHDSTESGDWSNLPPREKQKLEQLRNKIMSERHREINGEYRAKVAGAGRK